MAGWFKNCLVTNLWFQTGPGMYRQLSTPVIAVLVTDYPADWVGGTVLTFCASQPAAYIEDDRVVSCIVPVMRSDGSHVPRYLEIHLRWFIFLATFTWSIPCCLKRRWNEISFKVIKLLGASYRFTYSSWLMIGSFRNGYLHTNPPAPHPWLCGCVEPKGFKGDDFPNTFPRVSFKTCFYTMILFKQNRDNQTKPHPGTLWQKTAKNSRFLFGNINH